VALARAVGSVREPGVDGLHWNKIGAGGFYGCGIVMWIKTVWMRIYRRKPGEHGRNDVNKCITLHNPENILENESADILMVPVQTRYHLE
jgi:hypothetical protein